jgi:DNA replication and repair protein RecF
MNALLHPASGPTAAPGAGAPDVAAPALALRRIVLSDFRSYRRAELAVPGTPVVLHGANGAGKTNLLEAISFLAPGRGLRRARIIEIERRRAAGEAPGPGWAVFATLDTPAGERSIGTGRDPAGRGPDRAPEDEASDRRVVRVDGAATKGQAALAELVHLLWLTPEMDRIFDGGASERRRFLDRIVLGFVPDHARNLAGYEQAMRERNRLLKDGHRVARGLDETWLGALEQTMAENGVAVAAARRQVMGRLAIAAESAVGPFPAPDLTLAGETEAELAAGPALAAEDALRRRLRDSRRADAEAGRALQGPHRSDLVVHHRAKAMPAALCSTGEQKALLVALVLAAARLLKLQRGAAPLLLLDEIAAHLDAERRAALFDEIEALGAQAWMTGTDARLFESLAGRAAFFNVAPGSAGEGGTLSAAPQSLESR